MMMRKTKKSKSKRPVKRRKKKTQITTWLDLLLDKVIISRVAPYLFLEDIFQLSATCNTLRSALFNAQHGNQWFKAIQLNERVELRFEQKWKSASPARFVCIHANKLMLRYKALDEVDRYSTRHNLRCCGWCQKSMYPGQYNSFHRLPMCFSCLEKRFRQENESIISFDQVWNICTEIQAKFFRRYPQYKHVIVDDDTKTKFIHDTWTYKPLYETIITRNIILRKFTNFLFRHIHDAMGRMLCDELNDFSQRYGNL